MKEEIRKRLQEEIFDIFLDVKRVCEEMNIEYFIMGGTALGAVRHGGFIPWDDDFDIGMTRKNYERFMEEAQKKLRKDLFLQNYQTEEHSPFYFAKVRKGGTKFVERYCRKLPIHQGIYIDIFPYDAVPDEELEKRQYYKNGRRMLNWYIAKEVCGISTNPKLWKRLILEGCRTLMHCLTVPVKKKLLYTRTNLFLQQYNNMETEYIGYVGLPRIEVRRRDILALDKIMFEGTEVSCPGHIKEYLSSNFGNYWDVPPENERKGHDVYEISL